MVRFIYFFIAGYIFQEKKVYSLCTKTKCLQLLDSNYSCKLFLYYNVLNSKIKDLKKINSIDKLNLYEICDETIVINISAN